MHVDLDEPVTVHHHPCRHADVIGEVPEAIWVNFGERIGVWGRPEAVATVLSSALTRVQAIIDAPECAKEDGQ